MAYNTEFDANKSTIVTPEGVEQTWSGNTMGAEVDHIVWNNIRVGVVTMRKMNAAIAAAQPATAAMAAKIALQFVRAEQRAAGALGLL